VHERQAAVEAAATPSASKQTCRSRRTREARASEAGAATAIPPAATTGPPSVSVTNECLGTAQAQVNLPRSTNVCNRFAAGRPTSADLVRPQGLEP